MKKKKLLIMIIILIIILIIGLYSCTEDKGLKYTGYGANRVVSGSMNLIELDGDKILLDAGSFFAEDKKLSPEFPSEIISDLESIIISHAHSDHIGRLPLIINEGYNQDIFISEPTALLLPVMLEMGIRYEDLGVEYFYYSTGSQSNNRAVHSREDCHWGSKIFEENIIELKTTRERLDKDNFYLCSGCAILEIDDIIELIRGKPLYESFAVSNNVTAEFYHTPHIPGSVITRLEGQNSGYSLIYTGDYGSGLSSFLAAQDYIEEADWAVVEGTYSYDRRLTENQGEFINLVRKYLEEDKRIIVPAFVLDRTQQILGELTFARENNIISEDTDIYLLGSTANRINQIYYDQLASGEFRDYMSQEFIKNKPFAKDLFRAQTNVKDFDYGEIIIASPGMGDGGFTQELIEKYIEDDDTVFIFTGYVGPQTIGGRLVKKSDSIFYDDININNSNYKIRAGIDQVSEFSSHGTFAQISDFLSRIEGLKGIIIFHSDENNALNLKKRYKDRFPGLEVIVPVGGKTYQLK